MRFCSISLCLLFLLTPYLKASADSGASLFPLAVGDSGTTIEGNLLKPVRRHFFGLGISIELYTDELKLPRRIIPVQGEIAYWYEGSQYRLGLNLGLGGLIRPENVHTPTGKTFLWTLLFEAYYVTKGRTAFYIGGGLGFGLVVPPEEHRSNKGIAVFRLGLGVEFARDQAFRILFGVTVDCFVPLGTYFGVFVGPRLQFLF